MGDGGQWEEDGGERHMREIERLGIWLFSVASNANIKGGSLGGKDNNLRVGTLRGRLVTGKDNNLRLGSTIRIEHDQKEGKETGASNQTNPIIKGLKDF